MKRISKVLMTVMTMVLCLSFSTAVNTQALAATDPVAIVKNGAFSYYPGLLFNKAAEAYFKNISWSSATEKGTTLVTFTGVFYLGGEETTATLVFDVDTAKETFTYTTLMYDGELQSELEARLMLYEVMESYTKDVKTVGSKAVNIVKFDEYEGYENIPFGFVVQNFLSGVDWNGFQADDGKFYVDVTGEFIYNKKEASLLLQYEVDLTEGEYTLYIIEVNGKQATDAVYIEILEAMFNDLELE